MEMKTLIKWPVLGALSFGLLAGCDQPEEMTTETLEVGAEAGTTVPGPFGLPPTPIPADNPMSAEKVALGEKLFMDTRFSATGEVSCSTCHDPAKAFTDGPLSVSVGINGLTGTRNAPTVVNAAYMKSQFWDGREPDLEGQSKGPFINPVEMGLPNHAPILDVIQGDEAYIEAFRGIFGVEPENVTIDHVAKAIAAFERTIVSGNSPFDRWHFGGEQGAISDAARRGFEVYVGQGHCVSCHTISQNYALFSDSKFHNLNVSFSKIAAATDDLTAAFEQRRAAGEDIDVMVLTDVDISELGRFAVTGVMSDVGAFKTPTLRNIAVTAPYMHDGSQRTLEDVATFYNLGGRTGEDDPINPFQSGGIRALNLSDQQQADLVEFLKTLTSPEHETSE